MKIVVVHNTYQQPGGEDAVFRSERDLLLRAGHEVVEYQRSNDDVPRYVSIRRLALATRTIWARDTRRDFRALLERERPDVVHVHNTFVMISPSIYWACRDAGVPVVQTLHNYRLLCSGALFLREGKVCEECLEHGVWKGAQYGCYRGSRSATAVVAAMLATHRALGTWSRVIDCFVTFTEFGKTKFIAGGIPGQKIFVKPNFVHPDPGEGHGERSYALFVGRLSEEKGLSTLLAAWSLLQTYIPLHIVGDGPLRKKVEQFIRDKALSNVYLRGTLTRQQTMAAMQGARYLLFPSECYEGLPMTVIEAFACGTPVIASRMGAMSEIVSDLGTGLHFTPGNAQDLACKVEWAWTHPQEMFQMGVQARREYEEKYTSDRNYRMLMEIYQRAIDDHRAGKMNPGRSLIPVMNWQDVRSIQGGIAR